MVGSIISHILCEDTDIFWAKTFYECNLLLDSIMMEVIEFSYSILLLR